MAYTRIWVSELNRELLMDLAKAQELASAKSLGCKPSRVTLRSAAQACFREGLEDLQVRASDFTELEGDEE